MANIHDVFPSKYLKASELKGQRPIVTIDRVEIEAGNNNDELLVAYFKGKSKGMVINKTKANIISTMYGPETDNWVGEQIQLYETTADFNGKRTAAIGVQIPSKRDREAAQKTPAPSAATADDEVPF
jgi:hypothetical protein